MQKKRSVRPFIITGVIVVVLGLLIFGAVSCTKALSESLESLTNGFTELSTVEKRDISEYISVSGSVGSENMVKITSTLAAKVKSLNVELGSEVQEGDVLLEFDSSELQSQYDALKKSIENADGMTAHQHSINERNLNDAKAEKETTLAQAQRAIDEAVKAKDDAYAKERALAGQLTTQQAAADALAAKVQAAPEDTALAAQYQEAQLTLETLTAQHDALKEQLPSFDSAVTSAQDAYAMAEKNADALIQSCQDVIDAEQYTSDNTSQEELKKIEDAIAECTVRAPMSGIVTSLNVAEGSLPTAEALMTIEDKDALRITVQIAEADILKIKEGMPAVVTTTATGDQEFSATVSRVVNIYSGGSDASFFGQDGSSGGYSAEITIDEKNTALLLGMNAKVKIILVEQKDVLSVPYESILQEEDGSSYVLVAVTDENGVTTAKKAAVVPGMTGSYFTEISSEEVKEGDRIIMSPEGHEDGDIILTMTDISETEGGAAEDE